MAVEINTQRLDDILFDMEHGSKKQADALRAWLDEYGTVLVRPNEGTTLKVRHRGEEWAFPPRGQRIDRRLAVELIRNHGREGIYRFHDQRTGFTEDEYFALHEEIQKRYPIEKLNFEERYLTHITDEMLEEEANAKAETEREPVAA